MTVENELYVIQGKDRQDLCTRVKQGIVEKTLLPNTCKLAIVASGPTDLQAKLSRAYERLSDPSCHEIHDSTGIYYFSQGLGKQGKIAFLFPGEGAQYVGMLTDLAERYPIIRECSDKFQVNSLNHVLFMPKEASDQQRESAEKELHQLGTAMFSVLMADWAIYQLLSKLGLKADVMAGHSMGELAALAAAGCIQADAAFLERVTKTIKEIEQHEEKVPQATLLAVGTGQKMVEELVAMLGPAVQKSVRVAMDNCPHQSVVVGPCEPMALVEIELQSRGILFEPLPFSRPYHTELFEPLIEHLDTMFDGVTFRPGNSCVYSCTTAKPFSSDPAEIRRLAVAHWASPVKFTQLIEQMYADGVRIFVEVGPKGNLSAFVADILRGRSFASLPANLQRRSGVTQLNHLLAQLHAHGVSLSTQQANPKKSFAVMSQYMQVMEQFLDLQGELMRYYLEAKREPKKITMPLLGEIVHREPRKQLLMRRKMDFAEDLFANQHTIGGRTLSKVDPEHYGLPVIPGTFSLEMVAEAASLLVPGKVVIGFREVRLSRWLAYEEENPTLVEISAKVVEENGSQLRVAVEVHDLGTVKTPLDASKIALRGFVLLADRYPEPPNVQELVLTNERQSPVSLDVVYQNLFHGPLFQGLRSTERLGDEGIECTACVLPRKGLFSSTDEPNFIFDPVLADVSMHSLVAWHLEKPDQAGRILLPAEIGSLDLFEPLQPVGTSIVVRARLIDSSSRHFTHNVEAIRHDGTLLFQISGAKFWRFYVPFCKVNFHGPKDEYFLSQEWDLPDLVGNSRCVRLDAPSDLRQPGMRQVTARVTLSPSERKVFTSMHANAARLDEWLFGRIAAKDAIRMLWWDHCGTRLFPADIEIEPDQYGRPVGRLRAINSAQNLPVVSIAHSDGVIVALAGFMEHVGIDVEQIRPREASFEEVAFDADERQLLNQFGHERYEGVTRFWCAKEAVAKALGRGLVEGPRTLFVRSVDLKTGTLHIALGAELAKEFPEFKESLLIARTVRDKELVIATSFCERCFCEVRS